MSILLAISIISFSFSKESPFLKVSNATHLYVIPVSKLKKSISFSFYPTMYLLKNNLRR